MKKLLLGILLTIGLIVSALGLIACGENQQEKSEVEKIYDSYVTYSNSQGITAMSYEDWLATIKGQDGKDGTNGKDGLSAYELYKKYHSDYTKTEQEFLDDLVNGRLGEKQESQNENEQGLAFFLQDDGTYSVGIGYAEELSKIVIPATYNDKAVTKIKDNFANRSQQLTEITIPDSVKEIGNDAFSGCSIEKASIPAIACSYINNSKLETVIITSGTSIGDYAFSNCSSLKSVTIGSSVKEIGNYAFDNCISLTEVTIGEATTSIGNYAFGGCISLTKVTIGDSVESIGNYAFNVCKSLTSIIIPNSVESIGNYAFLECNKLVEVINKSSLNITKGSYDNGCAGYYALNIKSSGTSDIVNKDNYLFYTYNSVNYLLGYVGNETELTLPNNYNGNDYNIYEYAFRSCFSLTSITIGRGVKEIGSEAFKTMYISQNIFISSSLTKVNYTGDIDSWCEIEFSGYYSNPLLYAKNLYINDTLVTEANITKATKINAYAFNNCSSLTKVSIGDSVKEIGSYAFEKCSSLTSVTFSDSSNWYRIGDYTNWQNKTGGTLTNLSNPSTNATYFKSTYVGYYWYKLDK